MLKRKIVVLFIIISAFYLTTNITKAYNCSNENLEVDSQEIISSEENDFDEESSNEIVNKQLVENNE